MSEKESNKVTPKTSSIGVDLPGVDRSGTISPKAVKNPSNLPQSPRRFSSSSTRSYETTDYFSASSSPVNQRVSSAMSLYGRGHNRGITRRISLNSSISNFSTMSETSLPWTTKDIGFNAISGVLNDPNTKASTTARPTKNDIPSVPPTVIKKVKPVDFSSYLKQITPVFEKYNYNKECGVESSQSIRKSTSSFIESPIASTTKILANLEGLPNNHSEIPAHRLESTRNPYSVRMPPFSPDDDQPLEPVIDLPLLETVPSIFFDPDFNLENPRTFDIVCENTDIIDGNPKNPTISTNAILQEKLSHYLDTVEVHLIKEISLRSSSFFEALSNLQALHSETLECVSQINNLRQKLTYIDDSQAKQGLEIVRLKRRRANMGRLYEGLRMVAEISSTQSVIQALLGQGDYFSALDLIEEANSILNGGESQRSQLEELINEQSLKTPISSTNNPRTMIINKLSNVTDGFKKSGTIDLRGVRVLMYFGGQLGEMYKSVGVMMENDLLNMLFMDFEEHVENVNTTNAINILYNDNKINYSVKHSTPSISVMNDPTAIDKEEKLKKRITPLVLGLYRMNRFASALQAYRERMLEEVKKMVQIQKHFKSSMTLTEAKDDHSSYSSMERWSKATKLFKGMTFDAFLDTLLSIYAILLEGLKRIAIYNELFSVILDDAQKVSWGPQFDLLENEKGSSSKDLQVNDDNKSQKESEAKVSDIKTQIESNAVSGNSKISTALKITTGIKSIIQRTQSLALKSSTSSRDPQPKKLEPIPSTPKAEIKLDSNSQYTQLVSDSSQIVYAVADLAHVRCAKLIAVRADQNAQLNQKDFYRLFNVTWAFVLECESLCGRMCYGLRGTIISQAKAFLTHFHMERTKQEATLVENEQWIQAGVPIDFQRIVDKIIAASTKGLSNFKDNSLDHLSPPASPVYPSPDAQFSYNSEVVNGTNEKDRIQNNSSVQSNYLKCMVNIPVLTTETMNRIVEILNINFTPFNSYFIIALASQSLGAIIALIPYIRECIRHSLNSKQVVMLIEFDRIKRSMNWDESNAKNGPNPYMESLVKETTTLHKVLNKYLPQEILQNVMSDVFKSSNTKIAEEIAKVNIYTPLGKERITTDIQYYIRKLTALEGLQGSASDLENIINNLPLKEKLSNGDKNTNITPNNLD
ncbi:15770_t:CDS:10 [Cetraspora pellucida]|uniref:Vacuolar protein sorting-associated protein 54 n=1 Tax=Cetraspora pellucida TaxID=1433469 RepID=A0A9N8WBD2_9GLOM|nr:15770_t:CDS:10 [Cetraspora pellucida]